MTAPHVTWTPAQLAVVAEWLGYASLWYDAGTDSFWVRYRVGLNEEIISHADLFCAIDDKAVADGLDPELCYTIDPATRVWFRRYRFADLRPAIRAVGPDRLSAAIGAVLKLREGV